MTVSTVRLSVRLHRQLRIRDMILVDSPHDYRIHVQRQNTPWAWCSTDIFPQATWGNSACRDCIRRVIVEFQDTRAGDLCVGDTIIWEDEEHFLSDLVFSRSRVCAFTTTELFVFDERDPIELGE